MHGTLLAIDGPLILCPIHHCTKVKYSDMNANTMFSNVLQYKGVGCISVPAIDGKAMVTLKTETLLKMSKPNFSV